VRIIQNIGKYFPPGRLSPGLSTILKGLMKVETLEELTPLSWYDEDTGSIIFSFDRVAVSFSLDEFLDFANMVEDTCQSLLSKPEIVIGVYEEGGEQKKELTIMPDERELN
jgi:hypothetical protein